MRLFCLFIIAFISHVANASGCSCKTCYEPSYGNAGFTGNISVDILVPSWPSYQPFPGNRNFGFIEGTALLFSPSGFVITEDGDYDATLTVVLFGNESIGSVEFNIFLVTNQVYDSTSINLVGASNTVNPGQVAQFQGSNILRLKRGEYLGLVINNGVGAPNVPTQFFAWGITIRKVSANTPSCCK